MEYGYSFISFIEGYGMVWYGKERKLPGAGATLFPSHTQHKTAGRLYSKTIHSLIGSQSHKKGKGKGGIKTKHAGRILFYFFI